MRVSIDDRLARLCEDFSVPKIGEWLERKFASYDTSRAEAISIAENKNDKEYFKSARLLGFVRDLPDAKGANRPLLVAAVEMRKILTERTSRQAQFNFAKRVLQNAVRGGAAGLNGYPSQGLFFFYDQDQFFRISLVSGEMDGRKFKFNEAKRQSFYINPDRPNNIAKSRLSEPLETFSKLKDAFSVEALTKEFYGKLFDWYEWAMKPKTGVKFPNDDSTPDDDRKYNNEAIIRLITRLMFTWFIRQRDMVQKDLFTVEGVDALLKEFDPKSMDQDNYYRCILQNLFFATLNCQPEKRGFIKHKQGNGYSDQHNVKTFYRYEKEFKDAAAFKELLSKTPFLNCALFDCLDKQQREMDGGKLMLFDGFSDTGKRQAHVPNGLFFHPEKGIIRLFDTYEFTIDENNADDADVALDPELLGKVFENLLGAFNPETQQTARSATGSFYTPREIVDYMVEESLKNHIKTKVPRVTDAGLKELFDKTAAAEKRELPFDDDVAAEIREALYSCKILDPACGSGAFPMGILHCMVRLFGRLDPSNTDLNRRLILRYKQETNQMRDPSYTEQEWQERQEQLKVQLDEGQHYPDYARKLYLIENCIYGVDIQPIATQISKLRFFISLLCDQLRENWSADGENHGLLSLPNLEAKFVCANTLISLPKTEGELELMSCSKIPKLREKLQENRHRIFAARTFRQKEKLKERDLELRDEIRETVRSTLAKPDKELIKVQEGIIAKLRKDRIPYETPKMIKQKKAVQDDFFAETQGALAFEMVDANKSKRDQIDSQIDFAQRKIDSELAKSSAANVTKIDQLATLVAGWDPYDQNASSSFFDPEWMFNISTGFDIVIGNPPYVLISKDDYAQQYLAHFKYQEGKIDLYRLFIEKAFVALATKDSAVVSYITPNTFLGIPSCKRLREYLLSQTSFLRIINFATDVFEGACVNNVVFVSRRCQPADGNEIKVSPKGMLSEWYTIRQLDCLENKDNAIKIFQNHQVSLVLEKMRSSGVTIGEAGLDICLGEQPYHNTIHTKKQMEERFLHANCPINKNYLQELGGRDIFRYYARRDRQIYLDYSAELYTKPPMTYFSGLRLILREIPSTTLICALAEEKFLVNKSCYVIKVQTRCVWTYQELAAILNSRIVGFWVSNSGEKTQQNLFPRISMASIRDIPLPENKNKSIIVVVDRILAAKKKDPDADTSALEAEIDQLVYKLYGLTEDEIAIVEGRGNEKAKAKGEGEESGAAGVCAQPSRRRGGRVNAAASNDVGDEELE